MKMFGVLDLETQMEGCRFSIGMGARSYIVRGKGNPESFMSCSHGAGRAMSRAEAKRRFTLGRPRESNGRRSVSTFTVDYWHCGSSGPTQNNSGRICECQPLLGYSN